MLAFPPNLLAPSATGGGWPRGGDGPMIGGVCVAVIEMSMPSSSYFKYAAVGMRLSIFHGLFAGSRAAGSGLSKPNTI
jgi:hypothetical protein